MVKKTKVCAGATANVLVETTWASVEDHSMLCESHSHPDLIGRHCMLPDQIGNKLAPTVCFRFARTIVFLQDPPPRNYGAK